MRFLPVVAVPKLCSFTLPFSESIVVSVSSVELGTSSSLSRTAFLCASSDEGLGSTAAEISFHSWTYARNMRLRKLGCADASNDISWAQHRTMSRFDCKDLEWVPTDGEPIDYLAIGMRMSHDSERLFLEMYTYG